jgi:hypothetical protein
MTMVDFSESDLLRNKLVPPAWYTLELGAVGPWTPTKDQQSNNCLIEAVILRNADTGETEGISGIPITLQFNDKPKARGFIEGFLRALGVDVQAGRYNLGAAVGQKIDAFVENNTWEGRTSNRASNKFRTVRVPEGTEAST